MTAYIKNIMLVGRALLFYIGYSLATFIWGALSLIIAPFLSFPKRHVFINQWSRFVLFWLKVCCGITYKIEGGDNIPETPCIIVAKHQSQWETFFLQRLFTPSVTVLKKELLKIPFFGWALKLLEPIAVDRSAKRSALNDVTSQGVAQLNKGRWIVIFPEGTRIQPGEDSVFAKGGFMLANNCETQLLPITHNAGEFWNPKRFVKYPGCISVVINKPISTSDTSIRALMEITAQSMTHSMHQLSVIEKAHKSIIKARKVKVEGEEIK